jgi:hypothetical protein
VDTLDDEHHGERGQIVLLGVIQCGHARLAA